MCLAFWKWPCNYSLRNVITEAQLCRCCCSYEQLTYHSCLWEVISEDTIISFDLLCLSAVTQYNNREQHYAEVNWITCSSHPDQLHPSINSRKRRWRTFMRRESYCKKNAEISYTHAWFVSMNLYFMCKLNTLRIIMFCFIIIILTMCLIPLFLFVFI